MNNQKPLKTSFWDFKSVKVYTTLGEKILDFLVGFFIGGFFLQSLTGFFASPIVSSLYEQLGLWPQVKPVGFFLQKFLKNLIILLIIHISGIFCIFYLWKKRRHLAYGLLPPIFFSILFFILILINLFRL